MSKSLTWGQQGGAAFPVPESSDFHAETGMTLRDYFAAKAMPVLLAELTRGESIETVASNAYLMADAMLAERAQ